MNDLHILIAEDAPNWQETIGEVLTTLKAKIKFAATYDEARQLIKKHAFDLAIIDLSLALEDPHTLKGENLIAELREHLNNRYCAVIVVSGNVDATITDRLIREYGVFKVIDKSKGDDEAFDEQFTNIVRAALLNQRLSKAAAMESQHYRITVIYDENHLLSSELIGPGRRTIHTGKTPTRLNVEDLVTRADLLNAIIIHIGAEVWRPEAKSIGKAIYDAVIAHRHVFINVNTAQTLAPTSENVWLEFAGPSVGLGLPFELMRDEQETPLALHHIITRQITGISRKPEPFYQFIRNLQKDHETLRILLIGANSDGVIPMAEVEATTLEASFKESLAKLGIECDITCLSGEDATYDNVKDLLQQYDYHLLHYSGHARFDDDNPENSGLVLRNDNVLHTLTATDLNSLTRNKNLRLVYLSSCTSARTADRAGRGDFHSVFDALAKADVPVVMGFRWSVSDTPALEFAQIFYQELWRTFSPGTALLKARQNAERGPQGRDNDTWLSPVMLLQSA